MGACYDEMTEGPRSKGVHDKGVEQRGHDQNRLLLMYNVCRCFFFPIRQEKKAWMRK